ncbi:DUF4335 domain-containing protein [Calothrix sp. FACHB-1219]|uniref:DUF4335 domain-containing protein n=1 Tax=unclassified Calothrix TaxID=2619626 RepID=UPI00168322BA|nr:MULTISPECIES: DUF4335 domain-containing protein [unclassified Calothrix]MBD2200993.1 DUF4335 domain-containing protein [Calothrix sp. FACHB-168]MBD2215426.1 DUF4335 domain-containing protein [Calothrix sp. FACHB-1219]
MNIQRKYSLPNCTLLLEGLSDATRAAQFQELRPELSILVNAECYLSSYKQPLRGGREFFESLVRAVSGYAQEFLSNVPNPQAHNRDSELVEIQKIDINRHRLIVHSEGEAEGFDTNPNRSKEPIEVDLNTVQLFDLVEAVDQFFADTQTLPELSLELQPVARRGSIANQALLKQVVPASVGVSSLAVAALALTLVPSPQLRTPETKSQEPTSSTTPSPIASATPVAVESTPTATPSATPVAVESTPTPSPTVTPADTATPTASVTPTASPAPTTATTVQDLEALLTTVPEITDASKLRALNRQVYNQINPAWTNRSGLQEDLVYRVGTAADGAIIGYKPVNKKANDDIQKTPLPNLLYNPAQGTPIGKEPIAQFKVVLTRTGELQVSPWRGYTKTPEVVGVKITEPNAVKSLSQNLYNTVRQRWGGKPSFDRDLKYRVAVNKDGAIADYEPLNQVAYDYARETPLPVLLQAAYGSNLVAPNTKEPLAHFQLIFQPSGKLEISPWNGYQ